MNKEPYTMSSQAEGIIRTTLLGVANTLGVQIDVPDEMIADLAARLQAEIDRTEAVEAESFEFLNDLALAFRRGEKNARPQHTPILEGVRAVLAHLQSTGRLLADDEMRLTAEHVEDVRLIASENYPLDSDPTASINRLRALFPATEPAAERCKKWTVRVAGGIETGIRRCVLPAGHECFHDYVPPVPAEPATQSAGGDCFDVCEGHPSPLEPAAEVQSWPSWGSVPDGVWFTKNGLSPVLAFRKRGQEIDHQYRNGAVATYPAGAFDFFTEGPFVPAPTPAPAEPAEDAPCAICNVNETNHAGVSYYHPFTTELGPFDDDGNDRPAPAEPAEEETKAETLQEKVADLESQVEEEIGNRDEMEERLTSLIYSLATVEEVGEWSSSNDLDVTFIDHMQGKIQQLERAALTDQQLADIRTMLGTTFSIEADYHEAFKRLEADFLTPIPTASSPVVPAPTETEWQTWQEVPEGVQYYGVGDTYLDEPVVYVNRPSVVRHRVDDGKRSSTPDYEVESFAPFVAAKEG